MNSSCYVGREYIYSIAEQNSKTNWPEMEEVGIDFKTWWSAKKGNQDVEGESHENSMMDHFDPRRTLSRWLAIIHVH